MNDNMTDNSINGEETENRESLINAERQENEENQVNAENPEEDGQEFDIAKELKKLPASPGVYIMHGPRDEIIYVGKAVSLRNRVRQYFQSSKGKTEKIKRMISLIRRFEYIVVDSEMEALVLENNLIKENRPKYNTLLKDDKTYPYIKVTVEETFPRIFMTRKVKKDKARYFGPYTSGLAVKDSIDLLHKLFRIRTCSRRLPEDIGKERPCLYYHLGQCLGPCNGYIDAAEYRKHIDRALEFLSGKYDAVRKYLRERMETASENLEFEKAIEYRGLLQEIEALAESQKVTSTDMDDRDIIGISQLGRDAAAQVFFIRGGRMIGRENYHLDVDTKDTAEEILQAFLNQFYTGTPYIPGEIWVQTVPSEQELTEAWLSKARGQSVHIITPKRGKKEKLVEMAVSNAENQLLKDHERVRQEERRTKGAQAEILDLLGLDELHRIESYDISNTNGFESVGSMVVFVDGRPKNSDYRKFRIRSVNGPNDYASMQEVLTRRFRHGMEELQAAGEPAAKGTEEDLEKNMTKISSFGKLPDLIMMDGGRGQVNIAERVLEELGLDIPVSGMVKDDAHRTRGLYYKNQELPIDIHSEAFKLITRIQDETHRFAIEYHKSLRSKAQVHSVLDDIEGIGPKRRRALMKRFQGIDRLKEAEIEELAETEGMNMAAAEAVYRFFHRTLPANEALSVDSEN